MENNEKSIKIASLIFHGVWLGLSLILWFCGLAIFSGGGDFTNWIIWGALCAFPIIIPTIKMIAASTKSGAKDGSRNYTASVEGNTVYVQNHPFMGAVIGFGVGILGALLIGPILLAVYIVKNVFKTIVLIKEIRNISK